ncbi:MAG: hypothetical protein FWD33_03135 [Alphaproteobacteria bacterium]|nr:hypothetical protein [Alphaproteobacteria bacterium]
MKKTILLGAAVCFIAGQTAAADKNFYIGAKGMANFVSHNFYATIPAYDISSEKVADADVSFGMQQGLELSLGKYLSRNWRAQVDLGALARRDEKLVPSQGLGFFESAYYATLNGIYGTGQGFYIGAGAGAAYLKTGIEDYAGGSNRASGASPMGAVMIGFERDMSGGLTFDAGVKTFAWYGKEHRYEQLAEPPIGVEGIGTGLVWNLALTLGVRYNF